MEILQFEFLGKVHYADYSLYYRAHPKEVIGFIVYPRDQEIQFLIGASKTFTFQQNSEKGITFDCPDKSGMTRKLCESIADALYQKENLKKPRKNGGSGRFTD